MLVVEEEIDGNMERLTGRQEGPQAVSGRKKKTHTESRLMEWRGHKMYKQDLFAVVFNFSREAEGTCWCLCATTPQPTPSL